MAQVLLSAFLSAPQGESVPGLPGMRTTQAAQQSRLADGAQALAVPVRLKQPFVIHQLEYPKKPPLYDFLSILKTRGSCNAEQKVAPLIPPRAVYCIPVFLEGGCGGVPRGRGEGGNLLRTLVFKLRHPRTALYFFTTSLQREADLWRLLQKECRCRFGRRRASRKPNAARNRRWRKEYPRPKGGRT